MDEKEVKKAKKIIADAIKDEDSAFMEKIYALLESEGRTISIENKIRFPKIS